MRVSQHSRSRFSRLAEAVERNIAAGHEPVQDRLVPRISPLDRDVARDRREIRVANELETKLAMTSSW